MKIIQKIMQFLVTLAIVLFMAGFDSICELYLFPFLGV